jgi:hypothetical protein
LWRLWKCLNIHVETSRVFTWINFVWLVNSVTLWTTKWTLYAVLNSDITDYIKLNVNWPARGTCMKTEDRKDDHPIRTRPCSFNFATEWNLTLVRRRDGRRCHVLPANKRRDDVRRRKLIKYRVSLMKIYEWVQLTNISGIISPSPSVVRNILNRISSLRLPKRMKEFIH